MNAGNAPVQLTSFDLTGLNAEGVMPVNESGQLSLTKLQVICDDGTTVYYADGIEAKDLTQNNYKKFNSDIIVSPLVVLPLNFEYFTASLQGKNIFLNW